MRVNRGRSPGSIIADNVRNVGYAFRWYLLKNQRQDLVQFHVACHACFGQERLCLLMDVIDCAAELRIYLRRKTLHRRLTHDREHLYRVYRSYVNVSVNLVHNDVAGKE